VTAQALEQSVLESKDKAQLIAIAEALGVKASARSKKSEIIDQILDMTGASRGGTDGAPKTNGQAAAADSEVAAPSAPAASAPAPAVEPADAVDEPKAEWELDAGDSDTDDSDTDDSDTDDSDTGESAGAEGRSDGRGDRRNGSARTESRPQAERNGHSQQGQGGAGPGNQQGQGQPGQGNQQGQFEDGESRNKRRRRRRKNRGGPDAGPQGEDREQQFDDDQPPQSLSMEPVMVEGYLDLRDEGYGFIRVNNYLASKSDSYVPVKLSRQYGLRRGDHVAAMSRPAGRNEKNPAVLEIVSVNGRTPDDARRRSRFEDLTALFPDSRLRMEDPSDPTNMTARIIDLVCPIGKGQRGLIVSPPKAGKTTVMKTIAKSIEQNNPEVRLIVLLVDERPEEVTDMRR
jgi:transcription termination factor Rho